MSGETKPGTPEDGRPTERPEDEGAHAPEGRAAGDADVGAPESAGGDAHEGADVAVTPTEAALRAELEEARNQTLRALAEAENVRRRAQRDVADARQYAITAFARDLLNVSDNFNRALSMVSDEENLPADIKSLLDGVRMTERELGSVFERHGVNVIEPLGERFDPNRHQAMFEIEDRDVPSGTVVQVMQSGAIIGERTLRPAMVAVSKGGPKPSETQKSGETAAADAAGEEGGAGDAAAAAETEGTATGQAG